MFAEKFDALMNIAEVSNSLLGRDINMNSSHIGRLRSGARPLPKRHEYLSAVCRYLAKHITKEYQINALQRLTAIDGSALASAESMALFLEHWLLTEETDVSVAAGKLIFGLSHLASESNLITADTSSVELPKKFSAYLFGDEGKRQAVEQFFLSVLQEKKPQTLLLFSDENMAWLYEDTAFSKRWAELFVKVILKGNRVKIIHTVSRDLNEMMEAVAKWIPIYMTGMIEPYCYPRLRDGLFRRTLFIAPNTAAVVSSSVQQNTEGMLNMFLTDKAALYALTAEYERYFALCRPLMHIFTRTNAAEFEKTAETLAETEGKAYLCTAMPPLFAMPQNLVCQLSEQYGNETLISEWKNCLSQFRKNIKNHHLTVVLTDTACAVRAFDKLCPSVGVLFCDGIPSYTKEQYLMHIDQLKQLESQYENLEVFFVNELAENISLYIKEDAGVIMAKTNAPKTAFVISEQNMVNAFLEYTEKRLLSGRKNG